VTRLPAVASRPGSGRCRSGRRGGLDGRLAGSPVAARSAGGSVPGLPAGDEPLARSTLHTELGLEPGSPLKNLQRAMLVGEVHLDQHCYLFAS